MRYLTIMLTLETRHVQNFQILSRKNENNELVVLLKKNKNVLRMTYILGSYDYGRTRNASQYVLYSTQICNSSTCVQIQVKYDAHYIDIVKFFQLGTTSISDIQYSF